MEKINDLVGLHYGENWCSLDGWSVRESKGDKWAIAQIAPAEWLFYYKLASGEEIREIYPTFDAAWNQV